ncbi:MAG: hypothetical protein RL637_76 [Pseudomonadota bacterium]|jgi:DNA-binding MarR family transcriptional regulator
MKTTSVFEIVERIVALLRAEERRRCAELGLQPVHLQVLDYLQQCNRYSDTPAAVSNYLGMTRGTVSQTLQLLEKKAYLSKKTDQHDKRVVHLHLSVQGKAVLQQTLPNTLFLQAELDLKQQYPTIDYQTILLSLLTALQKANRFASFGLCKTCQHFDQRIKGGFCQLTEEALTVEDSEKICQEHQPKADA